MFRKILLPVDLSDERHADAAVEEARKLALVHGSDVRVVTVIDLPPAPAANYQTRYMPDEMRAELVGTAEREAEAIAKSVQAEGHSADAVVRSGKVYHEVLEEAESWGADLIVMGSHHPGMQTYLLGSNAARIARHADCSVLILRTRDD